MKTDKVYELNGLNRDIPKSIEVALLKMYGADSINNLSNEDRERINKTINSIFSSIEKKEYHNIAKEYALYYLPLNMYKVWRPLVDLLEKGQIRSSATFLELGCGPGSISFGVFEFYKILAQENKDITFNIKYTVVEQENCFLEVFDSLFEKYLNDLPKYLNIDLLKKNMSVTSFLEVNQSKFDYILEGNILNPNERIDKLTHNEFINKVMNLLKNNSSFILIEPAQEDLSSVLKNIKCYLVDNGFSIYSPCMCKGKVCNQFVCSSILINNIMLINDLYSKRIIDRRVYKERHFFEYLVVRNDTLTKYDAINNKISLLYLNNHIGETINFKAYIIGIRQYEDSISIKICDGSLINGKGVYFNIFSSRSMDNQMDVSRFGRGGLLKVKRAKIMKYNVIENQLDTEIIMEI